VSSFHYAVDLDLAREVVGSLTAIESSLDEVVVDLRWRVARLHEEWAGTAAGAHLAAHSDWEASYREMHAALVAMRRALGTAADNYHAAASANASMWRAVR
jgi:early secretory antigenic target protein ESAT-6